MAQTDIILNPKILEVLRILSKGEVQASRLAEMVSFGETTYWKVVKLLRELDLIEEVAGFNEEGRAVKLYKLSKKGWEILKLADKIEEILVG